MVILLLSSAPDLTWSAPGACRALAPAFVGHATGAPFVGYRATAPVAATLGARSTDLPGFPSRAAPV